MALAVCLYDGTTDGSEKRFALKADSFSINYVKTPIQIPIANGGSPELIDIGTIRPSITVTGLVDTDDPSETVSGPTRNSSTSYVVPTKEQLEDFVTTEFFNESSSKVEVMISDGSGTPVAAYEAAISQARFDLAPATEDRFSFTMVFVTKFRSDS
jgi:hypothetical protein|tara:strand:- start:10129 stop:10596 length:468 start_codon:yes stop_codon:yes gene_type:complete